jgi:predicted phosphodiesterase
MKIAVISDLHMGPTGDTNPFGHSDERFARFLGFLESNFEKIILLGDIWETLMTPWPYYDRAGALRAAREAHRSIARRFEGSQYTYIHGNHDCVAGVVEGAPEELSLDVDGVRMLFTHGHRQDPIIVHALWLSEMGVWAGGWILRLKLGFVHRMIRRFDRFRSGARPDAGACSFQRWAVSLARARSADIVVTGHTHIPLRAAHGDQLYLNSGSCAAGNFSFLALDTKSGEYGVHDTW